MKVALKHRCDAFFALRKADTEFLLEEKQPLSNLSSEGITNERNSRKNPIEANSHKHKLRQGGHHKLRHNNKVHHRSMRSSSSTTSTTTTTTTTTTQPPPPMSSSSNSFHKSPSNIINSVLALRGVIPKKTASHRLRSSSQSQRPATTSSQFLNPKDPKHYRDLQTQYYSSQEDAFHSPAAAADTDNNSSSNLSSSSSSSSRRSRHSNRLFSSNFEYSNDDEDDANAKQNLPQNVHSIDNIYNSRSRNHNYNNHKSSRNTSSKRKHKNFLFRQKKDNKNINFIPTYIEIFVLIFEVKDQEWESNLVLRDWIVNHMESGCGAKVQRCQLL